MYRYGYRYRLLSLAFILCGVLLLMLANLGFNLPLFVLGPSLIASGVIILGAILILIDHGQQDKYLEQVSSKFDQLMDYKEKILDERPEMSANELEKELTFYADVINFKEFKQYLRDRKQAQNNRKLHTG